METRKLEFVKQQLANYSGAKKIINEGSCFVLCPFHSERTPSGRIHYSATSKSPGYFVCYGCGVKKPWDNVAPLLGLEPFKWTKPQPVYAQALLEDKADVEVFEHAELPDNKTWRSIKTSLLKDVGCSLITQYDTKFIYMPVFIKGMERGYIRARLKKEKGVPSYLNSKGKWSESYGLFPYDYAVRDKPDTLVLVEGPRDALRLLQHNIPAVAILGTQSWSATKSRMIELTGVKKVIICMDGDDAGKNATTLLSNLIDAEVFELWGSDSPYHQFADEDCPTKAAKAAGVELWDPCNMPTHKLRQLKAKL